MLVTKLNHMHRPLHPDTFHTYACTACTYMKPCKQHVTVRTRAGITLTGNNTKAAYRVIVNEDEVIALLQKHNFTVDVVDFAALSHMDQLKRSRCAVLFFL